jgi:hypothetical protein
LSGALLDISVSGLIGVLVGVAATEVIGGLLTGSVPTAPTHVAAAVVAALLGYAMAVTVAFRTLLMGIVQSAEWVVGEVERLVGGVVHETESVLHLPEDTAHASPAGVGAHASSDGIPTERRMVSGIQDEP